LGSDGGDHCRGYPASRSVSDFSPEWLRLREPADHRSRSANLMNDVASLLRGRKPARIVDLGSGLGSNLRALSPLLPRDQYWRLVDADPALLTAARRELCLWGAATTSGDEIVIRKGVRRIIARLEPLDLLHNIDRIFDSEPHLITAAALFDLVSPEWIRRLADAVVRRGVAFYAVLTYNGLDHGQPAHPLDAKMFRALHVHQHRDKGFGRAAGPDAVAVLKGAFATRGYRVRVAASPWTLDDADAAMLTMLGKGMIAAVAETGLVSPDEIERWRSFHMPDGVWRGVMWTVGHADVLAVPSR
jgi:hypothetical protein